MSPSSSHYSLAGVRAATLAPQQAFIATAREVLEADDRVVAAYLVGGFAVGLGDAFSDVDLQVLVADEAAQEIANTWIDLIQRISPTVRAQPFGTLSPNAPRRGPMAGALCITPEWLHLDVVFHAAGSVDAHAIEGMVPLFDKAGLLPAQATTRPDRHSDPFFPEGPVFMFGLPAVQVLTVISRTSSGRPHLGSVALSYGVMPRRSMTLPDARLSASKMAMMRSRPNVSKPYRRHPAPPSVASPRPHDRGCSRQPTSTAGMTWVSQFGTASPMKPINPPSTFCSAAHISKPWSRRRSTWRSMNERVSSWLNPRPYGNRQTAGSANTSASASRSSSVHSRSRSRLVSITATAARLRATNCPPPLISAASHLGCSHTRYRSRPAFWAPGITIDGCPYGTPTPPYLSLSSRDHTR